MRSSLIILIATVVLSADYSFGRAPCIDEQTNINCTEAYIEYDNERARCKEIFIPCITQEQSQVSMCVTSEFCSDECRSIYHKVQWCDNTTELLKKLDLFCATSSDRQHQDANCLDFSVKAKTTGAPEYGYVGSCLRETLTQLVLPCSEACHNKLMSYRNECCSINLAVAKQARPGEDNKDLISLYSNQLWEHCQVASPQMCPMPACPTTTVPTTATTTITIATTTITTTTISEALGSAAGLELSGAPKHHMNWFILFITVLILFI